MDRKAMYKLSYGLFILTAKEAEKDNEMCIRDRKKVLYGKVREDVREILNTLCKYKNVEIIAGAVCVDHVHLSVDVYKRQYGKSVAQVALRFLLQNGVVVIPKSTAKSTSLRTGIL